jgi:signal peptidase II
VSERDGPTPASRPQLVRIALIVTAVVAVDQVTKSLAVARLDDRIVPIFWTLRFNLSFNSGLAFSQGRGLTPLITVCALLLVCGLVYLASRATRPVVAVALALILGGALGNLCDRLFRGNGGAVIDFIDVQWWPVFNVADIALSCGAVLLVLATFREPAVETAG